MARDILAVLVGVVIGVLSIGIFESGIHQMFPVPQEVTQAIENQDSLSAMVNMPAELLLWILAAYALGSFIGGFSASLVGKRLMVSLVAGMILMLGGAINVFMIPHPFWFILSSLSVYVPAGLIGGFFGLKISNFKIFKSKI